jgi:hypothetical protein
MAADVIPRRSVSDPSMVRITGRTQHTRGGEQSRATVRRREVPPPVAAAMSRSEGQIRIRLPCCFHPRTHLRSIVRVMHWRTVGARGRVHRAARWPPRPPPCKHAAHTVSAYDRSTQPPGRPSESAILCAAARG